MCRRADRINPVLVNKPAHRGMGCRKEKGAFSVFAHLGTGSPAVVSAIRAGFWRIFQATMRSIILP